MRLVCAWCNRQLGEIDSVRYSKRAITHGICVECRNKLIADQALPLIFFLDKFDVPVVMVKPDNTFMAVNRAAACQLKQDRDKIMGRKCGNVIRCENARFPEGCGQTRKCPDCTINTILKNTFETGQSHERVRCDPEVVLETATDTLELVFSTERTGSMVMMRIDAMQEHSGQKARGNK